jgi:predicted Fe-Mo cluster-binding NifX family protein
MKIAIPVKTNKENPVVAPLFGKAKWFAFVEDGKVTVEKNEAQGGVRVVDWLTEKGVDSLIIQHMGSSPYEMIKLDSQITVFYAGDQRIDVETVLKRYEDETLTIIDDTNESEIIKNH